MQKIIIIPLFSVLLMTFLVTGGSAQKRKPTPRHTPKRQASTPSAPASSIFDALNFGDTEQAKAMLKKNPALADAKDESGQTPLHVAAQMGDVEVVELLLQSAKDINVQDETGVTPLHLASQKDVAELLLAKKANVNARNNMDQTPLHYAVTPDILGSIEDPTVRESDAATRLELIKFLIENKADVNARDNTGKTPLHIAAASGSLEIVQFLIDNKADVNAKTADGQTPLGVIENYIEIIDLLRKHGSK